MHTANPIERGNRLRRSVELAQVLFGRKARQREQPRTTCLVRCCFSFTAIPSTTG